MIEVKLPDIGEGIAEGEVVQWSVKIGDQIAVNAPLLEVLTDKASVEIPSPAAGTVSELLYQEGDLVPVGRVVARFQTSETQSAAAIASEPAAAPATASATTPAPPHGTQDIKATPSIRREARAQGIDLSQVQGSGPYGRIVREDLQQAAPAHKPAEAVSAQVSDRASASAASSPDAVAEERIPLRGIRRKIAEQMVKAKFTAPDFLYADEADVSELVDRKSVV